MLNNKMTIYLLDKEPVVTTAWQQYFQNEKDVKIITGDFKSFMDKYKVDCIVSPGTPKESWMVVMIMLFLITLVEN